MIKDDLYFMDIAYNEAIKAYKKDEIPVGAVIVIDNKIISKGHNLRYNTNIVTKHAEIIAIEKANKKINNWRLINAVMYCTLEPCNMCKEIIKEAKINKVIYATKSNEYKETNNYLQINSKRHIDKCEKLLKNQFNEIRNK